MSPSTRAWALLAVAAACVGASAALHCDTGSHRGLSPGFNVGCCVTGSYAADITVITGEHGPHAVMPARIASDPSSGCSALVFGSGPDVENSVAGLKIERAPQPGRAASMRLTAWWGGDAIHGGARKCFSWASKRVNSGFHPCVGGATRFPTCAGASNIAGAPVHRYSRTTAFASTMTVSVTEDDCHPVVLMKTGHGRGAMALFENSTQLFSDSLLALPAACDGVVPPAEVSLDASGVGSGDAGGDDGGGHGGESLLGAAAGDAPAWMLEAVGSFAF